MKDDIKKLLTKLEHSENIQTRQADLIEKLRSENDLLSSTILKNELGEINEERRQLRIIF